MTRITLHDSQEPFTPRPDRSAGFYRDREPVETKPEQQGNSEAGSQQSAPGTLSGAEGGC